MIGIGVVNDWDGPPEHECPDDGIRFHHNYRIAAYGSVGERVMSAYNLACYTDEALLNPQFVADGMAPQWPGRTFCVWSDHTVTPPERLADARPDAMAGGPL